MLHIRDGSQWSNRLSATLGYIDNGNEVEGELHDDPSEHEYNKLFMV